MNKLTVRDLILLMLVTLASVLGAGVVLYWLVQILAYMWGMA